MPSSPSDPASSAARSASRFVEKVGRPPGSVIFTGEDRETPIRFSIIDYTEDHLEEQTTEDIDEVLSYLSSPTTSWINVSGIHEESAVKAIGDHFGIHPLIQEDIVNPAQRPKVELQDDHLYITAKMLYLDEGATPQPSDAETHTDLSGTEDDSEIPEEPALRAGHVSLVVGPGYLISFEEDPGDLFNPVRKRLRAGRGRIRSGGADYLAYALLDLVVDHYFPVLETLSTWAEDLEDEILDEAQPDTQEKLNALRRDLIFMRRRAAPVRELLSQLTRIETPLWRDEIQPFVRDTYDHSQQVVDHVESLRDTTGSLMDLHMSSLSHRMNEIMKVLTIIGTIFIPLTFIAGIYGMNFEYMPELGWNYGYFVSLGVMGGIAAGALWYFRHNDWI